MSSGYKIFIDLKPIKDLQKKFPTVTSFCLKAGLNPNRDLIPITPAVHYVMGGVDINSKIPHGLGVAGEAAYTGVHGANRLASNSLLECLVYGRSEVERIMKSSYKLYDIEINTPNTMSIPSVESIKEYKTKLQEIMYNYCGIIRNHQKLIKGESKLINLQEAVENLKKDTIPANYRHVTSWLELNNMILLGVHLIRSAIYRKESRGAHFREDFPKASVKWDRVKNTGEENEKDSI